MAYTPSPRNCQEIPENKAVSLSRPGRISDMAYTPCPQTAYKCLKIKLRPYRGQDASRTCPAHHAQKLPSSPDVSRTLPAHRVQEIAEKYMKIRLRPNRGHDASRTWPAKRVPQIAKKCLKIKFCPFSGQDMSWIWPAHRATKSQQMPKNQDASLLQQGRVPNLAYQKLPKND
ncbi:Hypothetical predicted protein [Olea europaea subsp. europaea]|uniref:Uncharacterized protein n=1 Tax=Olea europaea subsp. europaea TaxID=158383 RepID=A0A8S0PM76_OLEEU|nr:Hypothetical predicted protein [Olea europaea subsp. europaea]